MEPVENLRQGAFLHDARRAAIDAQGESLLVPQAASFNQLDFQGGSEFLILG